MPQRLRATTRLDWTATKSAQTGQGVRNASYPVPQRGHSVRCQMACEENQWVLFKIAGPVAEVSLKTFGNERVMGPNHGFRHRARPRNRRGQRRRLDELLARATYPSEHLMVTPNLERSDCWVWKLAVSSSMPKWQPFTNTSTIAVQLLNAQSCTDWR
jgi:hypothetical protein